MINMRKNGELDVEIFTVKKTSMDVCKEKHRYQLQHKIVSLVS